MKRTIALLTLMWIASPAMAQGIDEDQLGAWYMYFFNARFDDSQWGFQGDVQYRNWDLGGDLEQLLLRGGVTWRPKSGDALFTLGYGNITTGEFDSNDTASHEERIYQEALLPHKIGSRVYLRHRRYEQRYMDFVPRMAKRTLAGREVETFDRNRYAALGYSLSDTLKLQGGYMYQITNNVEKGQLQLSLHQSF